MCTESVPDELRDGHYMSDAQREWARDGSMRSSTLMGCSNRKATTLQESGIEELPIFCVSTWNAAAATDKEVEGVLLSRCR